MHKKFEKVVLSNGLTVLLYKLDSVMSAYASLAVRVGAVYEKQNERGISHFTEHTPLLGTKKFPTKLDLSREAQKIGASWNAFTNRFATVYWIKLPYKNLVRGLDFIHEISFNPSLDKDAVLKERKVVVSEYNDFWKNPERRFWQESWMKRFKGKDHPYGYRALGNVENIERFDVDDVIEWRNKYYSPKNMILTITGNFDSKDIFGVIKRLFGSEKNENVSTEPRFDENDYSNFLIHQEPDERPQIIFNISFPSFGRDNSTRIKRMTLGILTFILSHGTGSRLSQRLREKESLIYSIGGGVTTHKSMGALEISSTTSVENLQRVFEVIREELIKLKNEGITDEELNLAKTFINYSSFMRFDNPADIAGYIGDQEFDGEEIWFPERYEKESKKITKEDVNNLTKEIIDFSRFNIGLLGNVPKEIVSEIKSLFR